VRENFTHGLMRRRWRNQLEETISLLYSMVYIASNKNQNWLLPPNIKDIIPKDHICFLIEDVVNKLDFSDFDIKYSGAGHPAYHQESFAKS